MNKRKMLTFCLLLCCAVGSGVVWISVNSPVQGQSQPSSGSGTSTSNPLARINERARAARSGSEAAIRALADEIFSMFNFDQAPAGMADSIKERLVRAEINYRSGRGRETSEFRVVHMVNLLANRLGAPSYARTNVFEVRRLQAGLLPYTPDLQSRASSRRTMSPVEAFFVAMSIVQQKRYNTEYQLTNDEWVALRGSRRGGRSHEQFLEGMRVRRSDSSRTNELQRVIESGFAAMRPAQILRLPEELLDALGVER